MGKRMADCLALSNRIEEYSIGADLIHIPPSRDYTIGGIHALRSHIYKLLELGDNDDLSVSRSVNHFFNRTDYKVARDDLNENLDTPIQPDIVEWISTASDHDIEQFCIWSLCRTIYLTGSLSRDKSKFTDHAMDKTEKLISIGLFPPFAHSIMRNATNRYDLRGLDSFHSVGLHRIAYCGDDEIGVSNLYVNRKNMSIPSKEMKRTMFHEYIHGGGNDRGFFNGITGSHCMRILEEAFVEHATVVAHTTLIRQPSVIHPKKRLKLFEETSGTYVPERTFLATTCDYTGISIEHLSEAYFSPRGDRRGEWLRHGIERKIGKFFGSRESFYNFINAYENIKHTDRNSFVYGTINELTKCVT
ncbi:MAG: hypothetical protein H6797_03890 [Candidatus Nomurabacteria bacterium]|nr:MAG: hypothetical protein H6797_03890 [Candidatus Nomurabacteria bacterium]